MTIVRRRPVSRRVTRRQTLAGIGAMGAVLTGPMSDTGRMLERLGDRCARKVAGGKVAVAGIAFAQAPALPVSRGGSPYFRHVEGQVCRSE